MALWYTCLATQGVSVASSMLWHLALSVSSFLWSCPWQHLVSSLLLYAIPLSQTTSRMETVQLRVTPFIVWIVFLIAVTRGCRCTVILYPSIHWKTFEPPVPGNYKEAASIACIGFFVLSFVCFWDRPTGWPGTPYFTPLASPLECCGYRHIYHVAEQTDFYINMNKFSSVNSQ